LGGEVSVTGRDAEEEGVVLLKGGRVVKGLDGGVLGRSVHLGQDLLRESLRREVSMVSMILYFTWTIQTSGIWKMSTEPPAALIPSASASAILPTWLSCC
jgi:hypothetical protein